MSTYPPPGPWGVRERVEGALESIETELRQVIAYMNDAVVPEIRRESIVAMRGLSDKLRNLADRFEQSQQTSRGPQG